MELLVLIRQKIEQYFIWLSVLGERGCFIFFPPRYTVLLPAWPSSLLKAGRSWIGDVSSSLFVSIFKWAPRWGGHPW